MYILTWVELIFEGVCGLKAADDRLYTFHVGLVQKLFHGRPKSASPPGSIASMFDQLEFPRLEDFVALSSIACKAFLSSSLLFLTHEGLRIFKDFPLDAEYFHAWYRLLYDEPNAPSSAIIDSFGQHAFLYQQSYMQIISRENFYDPNCIVVPVSL